MILNSDLQKICEGKSRGLRNPCAKKNLEWFLLPTANHGCAVSRSQLVMFKWCECLHT